MNESQGYADSVYGYEGSEGKGAVLSTTLNSDGLLAELDRKLGGFVLVENDKGEVVAKRISRALVNNEGRAAIIRNISLYASKDVKLSNIDKNEQNSIIEGVISDSAYLVATHQDDWQLDFLDCDEVVGILVNYSFLALSRGVGARELDHVYTNTNRQNITTTQDQRSSISEEKAGFLGFGGRKERNYRREMNYD